MQKEATFMMSHNHQKKIAVINDFPGFGRCSIAVALPIISVMKIQCCPVPTSIFSNHTGFDSFVWTDYTAHMDAYLEEWKKLHLKFNGICTGFLGSEAQIEIVKRFLREFKSKDTIAVIDPVMGDYGKLYPTYSPALAEKMHELTEFADLLTPNLTEACILTGTPFDENMGTSELTRICEQLSAQGPEKIVISGIHLEDYIGNFVYRRGEAPTLLKTLKVGTNRSGTGDVFSAIIAADAVNGVDFLTSVQKASDFIAKTIARSIELNLPATDGICFEEYLAELAENNPMIP